MNQIISHKKYSNSDVLKHVYYHGSKKTRSKWKSLSILFIIYIICSVSEPFIYQQIIDKILENQGDFQYIFYNSILYYILFWGIIIVGGITSFAIYQYNVWKYLNIDSGDLAIKLSKKLLHLPLEVHNSFGSNEIQKAFDRTTNGQWEIANAIGNRLSFPIMIFISMILLGFYTDTMMTVYSLLPLPLGLWWLGRKGSKLSLEQSDANNLWDNTLNRLSDAFINIRFIKLFSRIDFEISIIRKIYNSAITKQLEVNNGWAITETASEGFQLLVKIFIFGIGAYQAGVGNITIGELILFVVIVGRIYGPIMTILYTYRDLIKNMANYKKGLALLDYLSEIDTGKNILPGVQENIEFKNVSFSYPSNDREVLSDISFKIKKGERIALVGHTGSGKSTIIQLLMRFYEPSSGSIEIDGTNIYDYTLESYRQKFAAVFQDTTLFNETIRHNLEYVRDVLTLEDLRSACQKANILEFIESLSAGWETEVGERGLKLSGGEKQRIAIARAILANPEILILDEATSALDTKTEKLVQEAFDHLMEGRTSIIIAHRLSTIMNADRIYILEKGRIIDSGTHQELYVSSSVYREMVDLQHDGFVGEDDGTEVAVK